jgi:alkylation response protein AidB-like acyl-CoA dehydrogenase
MKKRGTVANLKPFEKGRSGNPKGRPKLPDLKAAIAKVLADEKDGYTALEACLMALRAKAAKGDVRAAEVLLDRAFGKAKQSHQISGLDGGPVGIALSVKLIDPPADV